MARRRKGGFRRRARRAARFARRKASSFFSSKWGKYLGIGAAFVGVAVVAGAVKKFVGTQKPWANATVSLVSAFGLGSVLSMVGFKAAKPLLVTAGAALAGWDFFAPSINGWSDQLVATVRGTAMPDGSVADKLGLTESQKAALKAELIKGITNLSGGTAPAAPKPAAPAPAPVAPAPAPSSAQSQMISYTQPAPAPAVKPPSFTQQLSLAGIQALPGIISSVGGLFGGAKAPVSSAGYEPQRYPSNRRAYTY